MSKGGRPAKYKNVEELERAINAYFDACEGEILKGNDGMPVFDKNNKLIKINQKIPTITGLALALGFNSRQSLLNYQSKKQFVDTITRAKSRVEDYAESRLFDRDGARGAEFTLKCNFKWEQKPEENGDKPLEITIKKVTTKDGENRQKE